MSFILLIHTNKTHFLSYSPARNPSMKLVRLTGLAFSMSPITMHSSAVIAKIQPIDFGYLMNDSMVSGNLGAVAS